MSESIRQSAKRISEHVLMSSFLVTQILIPLGVMSIYLVLSSWLLPQGVNGAFAARSEKVVVLITISLYIVFLVIDDLGRGHQERSGAVGEKGWSAGDLLLPLFPLTPVVQYIINNSNILSPLDAILIFCVFALLVALPVLVIPLLLKGAGSYRPAMSVGLAFTFLITNMASLTQQYAWYEVGALGVQLAVLVCAWLVSRLLFHLSYQSLLYFLAIAYFLSNTIFQLVSQDSTQSTADLSEAGNKLVTLVDSRQPAVTPSIYLLVYDSYVGNETMLAYGIDNQAQEQYLEGLGFRIYPHTYSVGGWTLSSMSRVLDVSVDSFYSDDRKAISGDGAVQNLLKGLGYKTYGIFPFDYFLRGTTSSYDYSFPGYSSSATTLIEAILVGEFRFDVGFDKVSRKQYVEAKRSAFSEVLEEPKFVYTHARVPTHSQDSGTCRPNEIELYGERLERANLEMRQDVEVIIENDPKAIVIVAGDHGPYLTQNCYRTWGSIDISEISRLDLQDRFGAFLAIRWPTVDSDKYDDIMILQDLFPVVFAYMFEDPELTESKIKPVTLDKEPASGAGIMDGEIRGGINHGEPLFTGGGK